LPPFVWRVSEVEKVQEVAQVPNVSWKGNRLETKMKKRGIKRYLQDLGVAISSGGGAAR